MWDDDLVICNNPSIRDMSLDGLRRMFSDVDSMMRYNPLTLLSWSITYHFWKLNPFWFHLGNWLLHGLNAALMFLVLRKLLVLGLAARDKADVDQWRITVSASLAALLWSLHPLRVEPVAWCTDRAYCQSLFFLLLSLSSYLHAGESAAGTRRRCLLLAASVTLYILSILSHAIGITFFLVLPVLDVYPLRKLGGSMGWWESPSARRTLLEKLPFAAAAGAVALVSVHIRVASAGVWAKPLSLAQFGLFERVMQAMYIWAYYLWRPLYPIKLSPLYTTLITFDPLSPAFVGSAIFIVGMIALLISLRRRWPLGLQLALCHLALLVPVLGVFEHPHYPCDRYSLIVSASWSVLLAAWLADPGTRTLLRNGAVVLSFIVIGTLGLMTFRQTCIWNDSVSLFEHMILTLGDDPQSIDPHCRLGAFLARQGQADKAIRHFEHAVELNPGCADAHLFLAQLLAGQKRYDEAIAEYRKALKIDPGRAQAAHSLRRVLGKHQESSDYLVR